MASSPSESWSNTDCSGPGSGKNPCRPSVASCEKSTPLAFAPNSHFTAGASTPMCCVSRFDAVEILTSRDVLSRVMDCQTDVPEDRKIASPHPSPRSPCIKLYNPKS